MSALTIMAIYITLVPAILLITRPDEMYFLRMMAVSAFNATATVALAIFVFSLRSRALGKVLYALLGAYFVVYGLAVFYHTLTYEQMLGVPAVSAVIDVNRDELSEYITTFINYKKVCISILLIIPVIAVFIYSYRQIEVGKGTKYATLSLAVTLFAIGGVKEFVARNSLYLLVGKSVFEVLSSKAEVVNAVARFQHVPKPGVHNADHRPRVHVVVIGESTTRRHMSLYGYSRPTNPRLESIRNELFIAEDACSSRGATAAALQELLSFANRKDSAPLFSEPNFIEVMKAAGYKTYWISNQQNTGFLATWASIFAASANVSVFINAQGGTDDVSHLDTKSFDEKLLAPFETALADDGQSKFILLHLMGSHAAYELRYPEAFAKFRGKNSGPGDGSKLSLLDFWRKKSVDVDAYDNSVLYNDYIVYSLIEKMKAGKIDTLTYLSDHGEGLGEDGGPVGHIDGPAPRQVYEIPLLFRLGDKFRLDRPELVERMMSALQRPFQTDHLVHTLLDLYGIQAPQMHPEWSLFSAQYEGSQRYCDQLGKSVVVSR